ncbi:hypothetical protein FHG87_003479 [Trinorchestia longiramus]|nr:hypothetical protein FHG87_003479 [Trinorchestia longiramus]
MPVCSAHLNLSMLPCVRTPQLWSDLASAAPATDHSCLGRHTPAPVAGGSESRKEMRYQVTAPHARKRQRQQQQKQQQQQQQKQQQQEQQQQQREQPQQQQAGAQLSAMCSSYRAALEGMGCPNKNIVGLTSLQGIF